MRLAYCVNPICLLDDRVISSDLRKHLQIKSTQWSTQILCKSNNKRKTQSKRDKANNLEECALECVTKDVRSVRFYGKIDADSSKNVVTKVL